MKARLFWTAITLICVTLIGNVIYAQSKHLSKPIFLDHYLEMVADQYPSFYYITNSDDSTTVSYVEINGIETDVIHDDSFFDFNDLGPATLNDQTYAHHALRSFKLAVYAFYLQDEFADGKIEFDELTVYFNDGTVLMTPIGHVILNEADNNSQLLDPYATTSGIDSGVTYSYRAEVDLNIENISMPFEEEFQEDVTIMLNNDPDIHNSHENEFVGVHLSDLKFPIPVKKGHLVQIYSQIDSDQLGVIEFPLYISGLTAKGDPFTSYAWVNNHQLHLTQAEVQQVIDEKSKGEFK